jgi:hypothetical protein
MSFEEEARTSNLVWPILREAQFSRLLIGGDPPFLSTSLSIRTHKANFPTRGGLRAGLVLVFPPFGGPRRSVVEAQGAG